jgi:integrase
MAVMPTIKLTAKKLEKLRATGTQTDYFDQGAHVPGFGIRVSAAGRRVWFLLYRVNGKLKRHTIGTNPPMGLEAARTAARRQLLGVQVDEADPQAAKKARRSADTFDALAQRFIEDYAKPHKATWNEDARQIRTMCLPRWKGKAAVDITRADVRELLRDVAKKRGGVTANRLRALISKLFRWSVSQDYLPANPASDLPKLAKETGRERVLGEDEIREFWQRANDVENPAIALWLKLRLLTGQRGETLLKMKWVDVDIDKVCVWEVPAADMKARNAHVVPLSSSVCELLKTAKDTHQKLPTYVLDGGRARRLRLGVTDLVGLEDFQPRDLRRTCATGMARCGTQRFVVSRVLGHVDRSVTGIYDRFEYLNEKRVALDAWARRVSQILEGKADDSVVPFQRGA